PVDRLARAGADIVVNINASPYHRDKWIDRHRMLSTPASGKAAAIAYVNLAGGQDELVFDGNSLVCDASGALLAEAPMFEEHLLVCDIESEPAFRARLHDPRHRQSNRPEPRSVRRIFLSDGSAAVSRERLPAPKPIVHDDLSEVYSALVLGTRDYVEKNGFRRVVLGVSGGIDSALVATIACDALGADRVTGVRMPSRYSTP